MVMIAAVMAMSLGVDRGDGQQHDRRKGSREGRELHWGFRRKMSVGALAKDPSAVVLNERYSSTRVANWGRTWSEVNERMSRRASE